MAYFGQSMCSSGISSGACAVRETITYHSSIDVVISSYAKHCVSTLEAAAEEMKPVFFDSGYNNLLGNNNLLGHDAQNNNYSKGNNVESAINYSIYGKIGNEYKAPEKTPVQDNFSPNIFLNRDRPAARFIGTSEDIQHYIKDAFEKTTGKILPEDMMVRIVSQHELRELHEEFGGQWNPGIQGFAINKKGFGQSLIICKENDLDRLLVTIGHELGHVVNFPLSDKLNEEAKAFAFEMAWLKKMHEHNIAGLRESLNPNPSPARNGLHDVAFSFVRKQMNNGRECFEIIKDLMMNKISVRGDDDVWM